MEAVGGECWRASKIWRGTAGGEQVKVGCFTEHCIFSVHTALSVHSVHSKPMSDAFQTFNDHLQCLECLEGRVYPASASGLCVSQNISPTFLHTVSFIWLSGPLGVIRPPLLDFKSMIEVPFVAAFETWMGYRQFLSPLY
jgi:hypothetical protein